jgi:hypothetical protein
MSRELVSLPSNDTKFQDEYNTESNTLINITDISSSKTTPVSQTNPSDLDEELSQQTDNDLTTDDIVLNIEKEEENLYFYNRDKQQAPHLGQMHVCWMDKSSNPRIAVGPDFNFYICLVISVLVAFGFVNKYCFPRMSSFWVGFTVALFCI